MAHRQKNMEFLKQSYTGKKSLSEFDKLCDWYFNSNERTIEVCVHRAYRDFCRRLAGIGKCKTKGSWREKAEGIISCSIRDMMKHSNLNREIFDEWHDGVCQQLITTTQNANLSLRDGFSYGLAQKWLNMTLKNMIIMEQWDSKLDEIKECLHVPVDRYIMAAASKDGVSIIDKNGTYQNPQYKENISKPWSQWGYKEYIKFQNDLRCTLKEAPIDWEGPTWIEIAKGKKSK